MRFAVLGLALALLPLHPARAEGANVERDKAAEELLNKLMQALLIAGEDQSAKAVLPLVQKSLLAQDGADLNADQRHFGFHRAHASAKLYASPVKVARVRETPMTGVGFKETAEKGRVFDYFLARKDGTGSPAPVKVFFPESGAPRVFFMGAL